MSRGSHSWSSRRAALQRARRRHIAIAGAATLLAAALALPTLSWAHAVVFPKQSTLGSYERYVLRVPNEKDVPTTRVELHFPPEVRVTSFADVAGWTLEVLTDSARRITGAVWTGSLAPQRFVEFPFVAVNPKTNTRLTWPAFQTYADGERVEWTGPDSSRKPASTTLLQTAGAMNAESGTPSIFSWLSVAALVIAMLSLGLALRKPTPPAGH